MGERRGVARRLDGIEGMSELQLREEKAELQRELLIFESTYGRPQGGADRQAVRLIYHRYRELKRRLSKLDNRYYLNVSKMEIVLIRRTMYSSIPR